MRYRKLSPTGDYTLGGSQAAFYIDTAQAVGQAVETRLKLWLGEWFLNTADGTDWQGKVLGPRTSAVRDAMLRQRILETPNVNSIDTYSSQFDGNTRTFSVQASITTAFGAATVSAIFGTPTITPSTLPTTPSQAPATDFGIGVGRIGVDFVG